MRILLVTVISCLLISSFGIAADEQPAAKSALAGDSEARKDSEALNQSRRVPTAGSVDSEAAKSDKLAPAKSVLRKFELVDGDRVVFIGNTFFEREGRYGYIETMLTARYPGRKITFRNLGWSGDTVWGESRAYFGKPADGYKNLIDLVTELKPTVIFVAYGNNEAFAGEAGLEPFVKQYNKLLDDLEKVTKRVVILGPIQHFSKSDASDRSKVNAQIATFRDKIELLATARESVFIELADLWARAEQTFDVRVTDNSMHGIERGYFMAGHPILDAIKDDKSPRPDAGWGNDQLKIDDESRRVQGYHNEITDLIYTDQLISFTVLDKVLPAPVGRLFNPEFDDYRCISCDFAKKLEEIRIDGLKHSFKPHDGHLVVARNPNFLQAEQLRQAIIAKNELFFHRWRPQNQTYLLGFRKHEQGQNAKEITQFDPLIEAKEKEIFKLAQPVPHKYEIIRVKDGDAKPEVKKEKK